MRALLTLLTTLLLAATSCDPERTNERSPDKAPSVDGPLEGLGLRFDGYYREEVGGIVYLIRFFPDGRAVLINGTTNVEAQLPSMLVHDAKPNPRYGYYNVPVRVQDDSLFFITHPDRGEISYRGKVLDGSRVSFLRHSHINGTQQLKEYYFYPDSVASK